MFMFNIEEDRDFDLNVHYEYFREILEEHKENHDYTEFEEEEIKVITKWEERGMSKEEYDLWNDNPQF